MRISSTFMTISILAFIPAAWIVMVPTDPTLRPDVMGPMAWGVLAVCAVLVWSAQRIAKHARARFDRSIYELTRKAKDMAAAHGFPPEIDLGETYPPLLVSRQHRVVAIAAPVPLLVRMDQIANMEPTGGSVQNNWAPREPHLAVTLMRSDIQNVAIVPGRGLGTVNMDEISALRARINEFLDPGSEWEEKKDSGIDLAAFIASQRTR